MRRWAAILGTAAVLSMASALPTAAADQPGEPAGADLVTHWEMTHGDTRTEGDVYWGSGYSAYAYGWVEAGGAVRTVCYSGSAGELGAGGECTTVQPGRTQRFAYRFFVKTEGGVHRVDVTLFDGAKPSEEGVLGQLYCTREGCTPI
ncbi:hypothetical protein [Nocardia brasiliensis]|uniref:hypothetical protein n=1 Tax=Nocardia brasiliensis TaxID=37326 RepID=UPI00367230B3